ncbi:mechanosensitive ion channel domain-containing protein [Tardiphaga sp.]|uniref:mechanosensitive ion channel domain-containing protein n=1 Tax=Tardiphaga sp. TaxID=1926292 RepID=UPI00261CA46C|nr:mechanosensitive ion channel domain-containing protein [Tardiphaga sp.]MDB5616307.1 small-conductance mechanosensitive channel [Tardiphaga sp.]
MLRKAISIVAFACLLSAAPVFAQQVAPAVKQAVPAADAAPVANALTPEQARRALETLQDDGKRNQMIETLRAIAQTQPGASAAAAPDAKSESRPESKPESKPVIPLAADSLGAQLLLSVSEQVSETGRDIADAVRSVVRFPVLWNWLQRTAEDPVTYNLLFDIAWKLALVFGGALAAEWLASRLLRRPLAALEARIPFVARAPVRVIESIDPPSSTADVTEVPDLHRRHRSLTRAWQSLLRLPFVLGHLLLELLPVVVFAGTATLLLSTEIGDAGVTRLAILAIVNAYVLARGLVCLVRALFGPLSLFTMREETSAYIEIWTRRIVALAVSGVAFANVALLLGLYRGGYLAIIRLVMLAAHLLVVVVILQCRRPVAKAIRAPKDATGIPNLMRNRLASLWHVLAIALVLALWGVWALSIRNGYSLLLQYFVGTIVVALGTRLASIVVLSLIDRGFRIKPEILQRFPGLETRANRYLPMLRRVVDTIIAVIGIVALLEVWGVDALVWFYGGQIGGRVVSAVATIGIAALVAAAVWEGSNALMDRQLTMLTRGSHFARAARLRTFQPMLRTTLLCVIVAVVALTALSEIGVNVAPLLAGAGILGIAIGFGSQKLVQDVITGLFLLLENTVQVGDNVTVSGLSGVVENVSIRTIRLRAGDGAVHIVPFSAVTTITNASRGAGNAAVSVNVAYKEDTDRAGQILKDIAAEMRNLAQFKPLMRGDLELWGVNKVDGSMAEIVGQIRCTDSGRWPVQREFNRRLKIRFQEEGIEIVSAGQQTILMQVPATVDEDVKAVAESEANPPRQLAAGRAG